MIALLLVGILLFAWWTYRKEREYQMLLLTDVSAEASSNYVNMLAHQERADNYKQALDARKAEAESLKRQIAARKGADTKRAKRLGECSVGDVYSGGECLAISLCGMEGPIMPNAHEAKRAFESLLGLTGKIKWEGENNE